MDNSELDIKYSSLIDELQALTLKFSTFLNGPAVETINTDSGAIKTLAGVIADLKKYQYVQKVIDHRLYADMVNDALNIEDGLLIRIWGDTAGVNGLYQKQDGEFVKMNYQSLNDLL